MAELVRWLRSMLPEGALEERGWQPAVDVCRTRRGWLIKCDLAGVRPEDLAVTLRGNELILQGMRRDCRLEQGCTHYLMEIAYSRFERRLVLPEVLGTAQVTVKQELGMLHIRIERGHDDER